MTLRQLRILKANAPEMHPVTILTPQQAWMAAVIESKLEAACSVGNALRQPQSRENYTLSYLLECR